MIQNKNNMEVFIMKIRRRFIERDYIKAIEMQSRTYITEADVDLILDSVGEVYNDYTFIFESFSTGWKTTVIDNITERTVSINDLGGFSKDFYIRQLIDLTKEKYGLHKSA